MRMDTTIYGDQYPLEQFVRGGSSSSLLIQVTYFDWNEFFDGIGADESIWLHNVFHHIKDRTRYVTYLVYIARIYHGNHKQSKVDISTQQQSIGALMVKFNKQR